MKTFAKVLALSLIAALSFAPPIAQAQQQGPGAAVTQTGSRGDAATRCDTVTSAGAALATVTMVNPGAGLSNYVTAVGNFSLASAATTTAAVPTVPSTSGFNGTSASIAWPAASGGTTAVLSLGNVSGGWFVPATPIKANANTAGTVNGGAAITGAQNSVTVCYYAAP